MKQDISVHFKCNSTKIRYIYEPLTRISGQKTGPNPIFSCGEPE